MAGASDYAMYRLECSAHGHYFIELSASFLVTARLNCFHRAFRK